MAKRRELTQQELDAAKRLLQIWNNKKTGLNLTQGKVAQICNWSNESAFGAYLHGRVPLNTEAVLRLSKILEVHPAEILPEVVELLPVTTTDIKPAEEAITHIEKSILQIFRKMSSKQKKDAVLAFENIEHENELIIKEYRERNENRLAA